MNKNILFIGALVFLSMCCFQVGNVFSYEMKEYFPLSEGDSWIYSVVEDNADISQEEIAVKGLEEVGGINTVKVYHGEEYYCYAIDKEGVKNFKIFDEGEYDLFDPPLVKYPNINLGETQQYSVTRIRYGADGVKKSSEVEEYSVKLENIEDVKVLAGNFKDCLKFVEVRSRTKPNGTKQKETCKIYLAPGVGKIEEACSEIEVTPEGKSSTFGSVKSLVSAEVGGKQVEAY